MRALAYCEIIRIFYIGTNIERGEENSYKTYIRYMLYVIDQCYNLYAVHYIRIFILYYIIFIRCFIVHLYNAAIQNKSTWLL